MSERFPVEELYPLMADKLNLNGEVTFTVSGWSMQPMVYNRRDTVTLVKPELPLKKYDLPFYRMNDGKFYLHRVVKVYEDGTYKCQGDNRWEPEDHIRDDQIIGVVKTFNRNGKQIDVNKSFGYWLYTRTWPVLHYFKSWYNAPKRLYKKLLKAKFDLKNKCRIKIRNQGGKKVDIIYRKANSSDMQKFFGQYYIFGLEEATQYNNTLNNTEWIKSEGAKAYYRKLRHDYFLWVAVVKDDIVGFCCGGINRSGCYNQPIGELINIFVRDDYRSYGIGSKLVEIFKEYCRENDCTNLTVTFLSQNEKAMKFYERHGFSDYKKTHYCKL